MYDFCLNQCLVDGIEYTQKVTFLNHMYVITRSSVVECVRRAAPEDDPLGSKHVVPHLLINSCCVDGRIGIYRMYSHNRMQSLKIKKRPIA
jgi:hypothetical protein